MAKFKRTFSRSSSFSLSKLLFLSCFLFFTFALLGQTDLRWDFKTYQRDGDHWLLPNQGASSANIWTKHFSLDGGLDGAGALLCGPDKAHRTRRITKLADKSAVISVTFSLNSVPSQNMTLFSYQEISWGRAYLGIYLNKDSAFGIIVNLAGSVKKKFETTTKPIALQPGQPYTLRVTLESGKMARIYLNGTLLKEDNGALCFADFIDPLGDVHHPFATFGYSYWSCNTGQTLDGKIYACSVQGGKGKADNGKNNDTQASVTRINANIVARQVNQEPKIDGILDDDVWKNAEWSEPFLVLGSMSTTVYGLWETANKKFLNTAGSAAIVVTADKLHAAIRAPFPEGMTPVAKQPTGGQVWRDDCVELFLHPDDDATYFQVLVNAKGNWQGLKHPLRQMPEKWEPDSMKVAANCTENEFTVEISIPFKAMGTKLPTAGTAWTCNFAREGATCGGLSTWAPVGTRFLSPEQFGKLVFNDRKNYFAQKIAGLQQELKYYQLNDSDTAALLTDFHDTVSASQSLRSDWTGLHNRLTMLENSFIQSLNAGKTHLLWQRELLENFEPNCRVPFDTRELTALSLDAARGSRAITSFLVTNLTDRHLMTRLGFTAAKSSAAVEPLVRFREVAFLELNGGKMIPDPIFALPIGSMLRVAPGQSSIVWLDIDTSTLEPGKYAGKITLLPSYSGFEHKTITFELTVRNVDLRDVFVRTWAYNVRAPWVARTLHEYGYNCINPIPSHYNPEFTEDGKAIFPRLVEMIETLKSNGVPHEEIFLLFYPEFYQWSNMKLENGKWVTFMEPEWQVEMKKRLLLLRDWLKEQGFTYQQYAFYPTDEPNGDPEDPKSKAYFAFTGGRFLKSIDENFQLFANPFRLADGRHQLYFDLFEILEPNYREMKDDIIKAYRESGREIWTYTVLEKSVSAIIYRHLFWQNLAAGFPGPAAFYALTSVNGDAFNSYDSSPKGTSVVDYATIFIDQRTQQMTVSRRQEAWYLGLIDFKTAKFCREKIAAMAAAGKDCSAFEHELNAIIQEGFQTYGKIEQSSSKLLNLAESLNASEQQ